MLNNIIFRHPSVPACSNVAKVDVVLDFMPRRLILKLSSQHVAAVFGVELVIVNVDQVKEILDILFCVPFAVGDKGGLNADLNLLFYDN